MSNKRSSCMTIQFPARNLPVTNLFGSPCVATTLYLVTSFPSLLGLSRDLQFEYCALGILQSRACLHGRECQCIGSQNST